MRTFPYRVLRSSWRHSPTRFYLSFTEGLRPFNTEERGKVYPVGGPGSIAVFLSSAPGVHRPSGRTLPLSLLLGSPVLSPSFATNASLAVGDLQPRAAHNTRRYEHSLAGALGQAGRGFAELRLYAVLGNWCFFRPRGVQKRTQPPESKTHTVIPTPTIVARTTTQLRLLMLLVSASILSACLSLHCGSW